MAKPRNYTPFGAKVKIALVQKNMTGQELSERTGIATTTISDVIFGRNHSEKTMSRIAEELGIEDIAD